MKYNEWKGLHVLALHYLSTYVLSEFLVIHTYV